MPQKQRVVKITGKGKCLACGQEFRAKSVEARDKMLEMHCKYQHPGAVPEINRYYVETRADTNNNNATLVGQPLINSEEYLNELAMLINRLESKQER